MKDLWCSYYTNSKDITSYMVSKLDIEENDVILEPSAGEGVFIDEILDLQKKIHIDALDINKEAIKVLKLKYENNKSVVVRETDTLLDEQLDSYTLSQLWLKNSDTLFDQQLDLFSDKGGHYTKVIGNPPYGAWQDYKKRELLKKKFEGHYVKETYTLFLLRCISVLRMQGKLSFIIPDTYLFLNMHSKLREILLLNTKINEILIFPSNFFPGISFGYSNLSIITLERCSKDDALNNRFKVKKGFKSPNEFAKTNSKELNEIKEYEFVQKDILANDLCRFILADDKIRKLILKTQQKLGNVADIVTGFYTGDNLKYIQVKNKNIKGSKQYSVIDKEMIVDCTSIYGSKNKEEAYIQYIKSAPKRKYSKPIDEWFVRWDEKTVEFYNNNTKSRFQNASYYFKSGIGIPMVKSNTIRAFYMNDRLFDQSIVGIFPKDPSKLLYILALMNSTIVNELIHIINPTANNSANYVKQIPYIEPNDKTEMNSISNMVKSLLEYENSGNFEEADALQTKIDSMIEKVYLQ